LVKTVLKFFAISMIGFFFRDLADVTTDGRLDKREFAIACCLISSQVHTSYNFFVFLFKLI